MRTGAQSDVNRFFPCENEFPVSLTGFGFAVWPACNGKYAINRNGI